MLDRSNSIIIYVRKYAAIDDAVIEENKKMNWKTERYQNLSSVSEIRDRNTVINESYTSARKQARDKKKKNCFL